MPEAGRAALELGEVGKVEVDPVPWRKLV